MRAQVQLSQLVPNVVLATWARNLQSMFFNVRARMQHSELVASVALATQARNLYCVLISTQAWSAPDLNSKPVLLSARMLACKGREAGTAKGGRDM